MINFFLTYHLAIVDDVTEFMSTIDDAHYTKSSGVQYNQAPHLTQDTNGKVTTSQVEITNENQDVSPYPAGDNKVSIKIRARKHKKDRNNINDPQKKHRLGTVSTNILLAGLCWFHSLKQRIEQHFKQRTNVSK